MRRHGCSDIPGPCSSKGHYKNRGAVARRGFPVREYARNTALESGIGPCAVVAVARRFPAVVCVVAGRDSGGIGPCAAVAAELIVADVVARYVPAGCVAVVAAIAAGLVPGVAVADPDLTAADVVGLAAAVVAPADVGGPAGLVPAVGGSAGPDVVFLLAAADGFVPLVVWRAVFVLPALADSGGLAGHVPVAGDSADQLFVVADAAGRHAVAADGFF